MAIRMRENGDLICAAMSEAQPSDTYIDDTLHYILSVEGKCIIADVNHENNGLWHWVHKGFLRAKLETLKAQENE